VLERIERTNDVVDVSSQAEVIDDLVADDAFPVDQEGPAQRDALAREDPVIARDLLGGRCSSRRDG
jgi:hypothetical protein